MNANIQQLLSNLRYGEVSAIARAPSVLSVTALRIGFRWPIHLFLGLGLLAMYLGVLLASNVHKDQHQIIRSKPTAANIPSGLWDAHSEQVNSKQGKTL